MVDKKAVEIAQAKANFLAVLQHYGLMPVEVLTAQRDRITVDGLSVEQMDALVRVGSFRQWAFNRNHGTTAVAGWRENCLDCSMQIVRHVTGIFEIDIDLYNPDYGAGVALCHLIKEVWRRGKTDPFAVLKGLRKRGLNVPDLRQPETSLAKNV